MSNFETHKDKDGLEDFFQKNLSDASMQPGKKSWENIEAALDVEEKKKKRFFWFFFSGLILLIGTASSWFLIFNNAMLTPTASHPSTEQNTSVSATISQATKHIQDPSIDKHTETPSSTISTPSPEEKSLISENKTKAVKIQLGAFSKQISESKFKDVPLAVQSETGEDGITRYFVITTDVTHDLETIKQAGFKDAFVKHEDHTVSSIATNNHPAKNVIAVKPNAIAFKEPTSTVASTTKHNANSDKTTSSIVPPNSSEIASAPQPSSAKNNSSLPSDKPELIANGNRTDVPITNVSSATNNPTKQNSSTETKQNESLTNVVNTTAKDSLPRKEPPVVSKADSITPIAKVDSVMKSVTKKDSIKTPPDYRWAVSLIGGPNIYLNQAKTNLFNSKSETQAIRYGGEIKAEYSFVKNLSASIGVGYQSHSIEKAETRFVFSKFMTDDYIVKSSFGTMAIDNSTLFQGFSMIAPIDSFSASYKYKTTIQSVNVPLQLNWYFLNTSRIRLYSSIGMNVNYIVSQQSHLTLIKEHHVDDFYYKTIQANKINPILLLSLGCDIRLTKRLYFSVAPSYRYALTNYSPIAGVVFKPSYLSTTGGFKLRF